MLLTTEAHEDAPLELVLCTSIIVCNDLNSPCHRTLDCCSLRGFRVYIPGVPVQPSLLKYSYAFTFKLHESGMDDQPAILLHSI